MEDGQEYSGKRLSKLLGNLIKFYESLNRLAKRGYSSKFIEFLALDGITDRRIFKNKEFMEGLFRKTSGKWL